MNRGEVYIIPDENQILEDEFHQGIMKSHIEAINNFVKKYNLCKTFNEDDYQEAPCEVARNGHLLVKTEENSGLAVVYIPTTVTDRQNIWFHDNLHIFNNYSFIGAYKVDKEDIKNLETIKGIDNITREIDRRNMFYHKKEDDKDVRKKI